MLRLCQNLQGSVRSSSATLSAVGGQQSRCRSTVAVNHAGSVDQAVKTVDDIPYPGGASKWLALYRTIFPGDEYHKTSETIFQSIQGRLYRIPIPFLSHAILTTSNPEHAAAMFRNEGEMPHRPGGENIVWFMNKNGFGTGLVIE